MKENLNEIYTVRRLFKQDKDLILNTQSYFNKTYFNPINEEFIYDVMLSGEFWGVFLKNELVAMSWLFCADKNFYLNYNSNWNVKDIFNKNLNEIMVCGYIYNKYPEKDIGIYKLFINLWKMQSKRQNKKYLVHFSPLKENCNLKAMFSNNFTLCALRGIENLVAHYIFILKINFNEKIKAHTNTFSLEVNNTKEVSKALEEGARGVGISEDLQRFILTS